MKIKTMSLFLACLMLFTMLGAPASAMEAAGATDTAAPAYLYNNYFTGGTGTMNSMAGSKSRVFTASSGGLSDNARVTSVELTVTVSRGSIPFYIVITDPMGHEYEQYVSATSRFTITAFNDFYPGGTWQIYIYNEGVDFTDVSTATASIRVNYGYDSYA